MAQKNEGSRDFERGGYRPLNVGYSPRTERGYKPASQETDLPKPPAGRTGESPRPVAKG